MSSRAPAPSWPPEPVRSRGCKRPFLQAYRRALGRCDGSERLLSWLAVTLETTSEHETEGFGERLAELLGPGALIGLIGPLGAGKTALVRGIARGCGVDERDVHSPTFLTAAEYEGRLPVAHVDLYRHGDDPPDPEWLSELLDGDGVAVVEWFEQLPEHADLDALVIRIEPGAEETLRHLRIAAQGDRAASALAALETEARAS